MAKTFIGELILRLKDQMSGEAKTAASNLDTSVGKIEAAARRMNSTSWGGQFEERLRKLGTSSADIDKLRVSWENLNRSFASRDLPKALQAMEKANFKTSALSYFADIASKAKEAETSIRSMHNTWRDSMKEMRGAARDMLTYGTVGTLMYGGANVIRQGLKANAEYHREISRQDASSISVRDQARMAAEADRLTQLYPSAGFVNTLELARKARGMMGDTDRGLAVLPDIVRAFVALQTASPKGAQGATEELEKFLKGADVAGINAVGPEGIQNVREVMASWVRAAQVEGNDLDMGKFLDFARYGKMAVPGLSNRFLGVTAPAIAQDYGASQLGNALNMAFKAFVIGSNSVAGKKNLEAQHDLGIREGKDKGHLVDDQLFGVDPYAWVKKILIPSLQKNKIDIDDNVAVSKAIGELTSNSNAATVLIRMISQRAQIDKSLQQYDAAIGPEAADQAAAKDPFVAWEGFTASWSKLATAIKGMPEAVAGLNTLTGGIQKFASALRNDSGGAQALLAGAGLAGIYGTWKTLGAVYGLITAGTNLNAAAVALEAAAVSLGGKGAAENVAKNVAAKGPGAWSGLLGVLGRMAPNASMLLLGGSDAHNKYANSEAADRQKQRDSARAEAEFQNRYGIPSMLADLPNRIGSPDERDERAAAVNPYVAAVEYMERRQEMERQTAASSPNTPGLTDLFHQMNASVPAVASSTPTEGWEIGSKVANIVYELMKPTRDKLFEEVPVKRPAAEAEPTTDLNTAAAESTQRRQQMEATTAHPHYDPNTPGLSKFFEEPAKPTVDMSNINAAASEATNVAQQMQQALSVQATPQVNVEQLRQAIALANQLKAALSGIGTAVSAAHNAVSAEMRRNFADHGVSP